MTKLKLGVMSVIAIAGVPTLLVICYRGQTKLRESDSALLEQAERITQLEAENEQHSNLVAQAKANPTLSSDLSKELLRLRAEVGMLRQQTNELGRARQETQKALARMAQPDTNEVSPEDRFTLQQTHAVDAMTTLLQAIKNYVTNHNGQYPDDLNQLTTSGDLLASNFAGNLGLNDFEFRKVGAVDVPGDKIVVGLRVPLQKPSGGAVIINGGITDAGFPHTSIMNVSPEAVQASPGPHQ
jgi:hypothetical protein